MDGANSLFFSPLCRFFVAGVIITLVSSINHLISRRKASAQGATTKVIQNKISKKETISSSIVTAFVIIFGAGGLLTLIFFLPNINNSNSIIPIICGFIFLAVSILLIVIERHKRK